MAGVFNFHITDGIQLYYTKIEQIQRLYDKVLEMLPIHP